MIYLVDFALAALFVYLARQKRRRFFYWFAGGMLINALTTYFQSIGQDSIAMVTIVLFFIMLIIGFVVLVKEFLAFADKQRKDRESNGGDIQ